MIDTSEYRAKYCRRHLPNGGVAHPAGGHDVLRLCNAIDRLTSIVRDLQCQVSTETQNEVERKLWEV